MFEKILFYATSMEVKPGMAIYNPSPEYMILRPGDVQKAEQRLTGRVMVCVDSGNVSDIAADVTNKIKKSLSG